jgi:hypothetical protein
MEGFIDKRIQAKLRKLIGKGDKIEEEAKKKALLALATFKNRIDTRIMALETWISGLDVIKKE